MMTGCERADRPRPRLRLGLPLALLLVAVLTGCERPALPGDAADADAADAEAVEPSESFAPPPVAEPVRSRVQVEIAGARTLTWEGEQDVLLTRAGGPGRGVNLLAGGFEVPEIVDADPRTRFRWAFDLVGQYADEPGTFSLEGPGPDAAATGRSAAFVIVMRVTDGSKPTVTDWDEVEYFEQYNQADQPCTLELGVRHRSGSLRCPHLVEETGKAVSLLVTWQEV